MTTSALPRSVEAGAKKTYAMQFALTNVGTGISRASAITVSIVLHPGLGADIPLLTRSIKLPTLKGNKTAKLAAIKLQIPSTVPADSYAVIATLTPAALPAMTVTGPAVIVTSGNFPGASGLLASKTLNFTATGSLGLADSETGSFATGDNLIGAYAYAPNALVLEYANGEEQSLTIRPLTSQTDFDAPGDLSGTTYLITTKAAKASFAATVEGDHSKTLYLHLA